MLSAEVDKGRAKLFGEAQRAVHSLVAQSTGNGKTGKVICPTVFLRRRRELPRGALLSEHRFDEEILKDTDVRTCECRKYAAHAAHSDHACFAVGGKEGDAFLLNGLQKLRLLSLVERRFTDLSEIAVFEFPKLPVGTN